MSGQCLFKLGIVTYFELNRDYIAEVLCINKNKPIAMCYGRCFLKKNLALADESEKAPAPLSKEKFQVPVFLVSENLYSLQVRSELIFPFTAYYKIIASGFKSPPFHPPSFLS